MKKTLKMILKIMIILVAVILLIAGVIFGLRHNNKVKSQITSKYGINESGYINLNGAQQYVHIRGQDVNNEVIIFLHGGPGFPLTYLSYYHQMPMEERYTVINWDQRGAGRTYYKSGNDNISVELMLEDVDALVEYAKDKFDKDKVIIIGQSWGTVLGSTYALTYPENVLAYVGVGQVTDFDKGKVFAAQTAMPFADEDDKKTLETTVAEFEKAENIDEVDISNLETLIVTTTKYLSGANEMSGIKQAYLGIASADMNMDDINWYLNAANTQKIINFEHDLINYMYFEFDIEDLGYDYQMPVCYIQGSNDYITPTPMAEEYYNKINAEYKQFSTIEGTGHTPFLDEPKEYARILLEFLDNID